MMSLLTACTTLGRTCPHAVEPPIRKRKPHKRTSLKTKLDCRPMPCPEQRILVVTFNFNPNANLPASPRSRFAIVYPPCVLRVLHHRLCAPIDPSREQRNAMSSRATRRLHREGSQPKQRATSQAAPCPRSAAISQQIKKAPQFLEAPSSKLRELLAFLLHHDVG
jgi:hypothetical protein